MPAAVTAMAQNLKVAIDRAYRAVGRLAFEGMQYRKDIGQKALAPKMALVFGIPLVFYGENEAE